MSTSFTENDAPEDRCKVRMDRGRERDIEDTEERGGREGEGEDKGGDDDIKGIIYKPFFFNVDWVGF
eukprot:CAMPEP_0197571040 /NCGR_PEP_ID=MMETSP1320-20131121/41751_1 /TAXON_ID=91990 /ORGANISM="Bolidomonas sp., Strain RCC2347" /LENGTH=66 /DNA_ID=CAMNT_0043133521 /DNA_START=279 /DNA_END=479 /DNA_ORIENTATION=-